MSNREKARERAGARDLLLQSKRQSKSKTARAREQDRGEKNI